MYKVPEGLKGKIYCNGCRLVLNGPSYFCKQCHGFFYLHEKCAKSPYQKRHPFHPAHPLYLYASDRHPIWEGSFITCDECKDISPGYFGDLCKEIYPDFMYFCEQCNLKLDVKCAALTAHRTGASQEKKMDRVTKLHHFSHHHKHVLGYYIDPLVKTDCRICELPISDPVEDDNCETEGSSHKKRRQGLQPQSIQLEIYPAMVAGVCTDDRNLQLEATTRFRELLSIEKSPPIEGVIRAGIVPRFIEFLVREDFPKLQFEAAWALTNIASWTSEDTKVEIDHGTIPILVKLLGSSGNVAGDSPATRNVVLGHDALLPLLAHLNENAKLTVLRNATWTLLNFCRGKSQPLFDQIKPTLSTVARLIHSNNEEVLSNACWVISYVTDGTNDKIQAVIKRGVRKRPVELLWHTSLSVLRPALRTVVNIVVVDDVQTKVLDNLFYFDYLSLYK
ncbi:hypothetical protein V6N13_088603 [Hibiscus sabdariffa]